MPSCRSMPLHARACRSIFSQKYKEIILGSTHNSSSLPKIIINGSQLDIQLHGRVTIGGSGCNLHAKAHMLPERSIGGILKSAETKLIETQTLKQ